MESWIEAKIPLQFIAGGPNGLLIVDPVPELKLVIGEQPPACRARKSDLGDKLVAVAETVIPDLRRHILFRAEATPVTFARYDWSSDGAIYGVAKAGRFKGSKSPIAGLVIAGSANCGPGVEAVVISGALAGEALMPGLLAHRVSRCTALNAAATPLQNKSGDVPANTEKSPLTPFKRRWG